MDRFQRCSWYHLRVLVFLFGVIVTGCGGDDGNSNSAANSNKTNSLDPDPGDVASPENTDVSVASVDPADEVVDACPGTKIKVVFDLPSGLALDPDTVNATTFSVTGPGATSVTAASVELDSDTQSVAFFTPQDLLVEGNTYTVTIMGGADGVKDTADPPNGMPDDHSWTFAVFP